MSDGPTLRAILGTSLLTAILTATAGFAIGITLERYKRHQDRRVIAATLLSEISTINTLFTELKTLEMLKNLHDTLNTASAAKADPSILNVPDPQYPITVYEKCADKIGMLGLETAPEVVWFYNMLAGFRSMMRTTTASGNLAINARVKSLEFFIEVFEGNMHRVAGLQKSLRAIVENRWGWLSRER